MNILITGGAGFIGSHLADALVPSNDVTVLDNLSTGRRSNIDHLLTLPNFRFIEGSITDAPLLYTLCRDIDIIFHEAAFVSVPGSVRDPMANHEVNATGTLNVLLAGRDANVGKVIVASSAAVYGDSAVSPKREEMVPEPRSPYAATKILGEYYCQVFSELYDLPTVCLRYFNVYGPRQDPASPYAAVIPSFLSCLYRGEPCTIYGEGEQTRDFIYVKDVVQANLLAAKRDVRGTFNIASGTQTSVNTLATIMMDIMEVTSTPQYTNAREGDVRDSYADISKARQLLGYTPRYSLERGLNETIIWFRRNG